MTHSWITAGIVLVCGIFGYEWAAVLGCFCFFAGREHAQAEYRYIAANGGLRALMPWYGGFIPRYWDKHSLLIDLLYPFALGITIAAAFWHWGSPL